MEGIYLWPRINVVVKIVEGKPSFCVLSFKGEKTRCDGIKQEHQTIQRQTPNGTTAVTAEMHVVTLFDNTAFSQPFHPSEKIETQTNQTYEYVRLARD